MRIIETLSKQIKEELRDARKYIECAMKHKDDNKDLADVYAMLASEEVGHSERLHKAVVREIEKFKATGKDVPEAMKTIWDWEHRQIIEESVDVKMMVEMYKR